MTEWWTYRLSDFLMFSARTYRRLFELYNAEVWPAHLAAAVLGVVLLAAAWRRHPPFAAATVGVLAVAWLWVAWAFHLQRYATINTAAPWFAAAFGLEAALLGGCALAGVRWRESTAHGARGRIGLGLLAFAVLGLPLLGATLGRPWTQAEVVGIAPDPTALATLGALLLLRDGDAAGSRGTWVGRLAWPLPILWCLISGATLWTMDAPEAPLLPLLAGLALVAARRSLSIERSSARSAG
jgi:uncharacterized membrane protein